MIRWLKRLYKYLYPRAPFPHPVNDVVTAYPKSELHTRDDATYLVRLGIVRTRDQAHALMKKYNVTTADELIMVLPKRRKRNRFHDLLMRIDGHDNRNPYRTYKHDKLPSKYWYRD